MFDVLKVSPDPIIFKAPFQTKKDEYLTVIKRYKVDKIDGKIVTSFVYEAVLSIRKEITYTELFNELADKFIKTLPVSSTN